ncbi:hypothetical protein AB5I41_05555 [Sphingomonas sp. MMS24-JH45]
MNLAGDPDWALIEDRIARSWGNSPPHVACWRRKPLNSSPRACPGVHGTAHPPAG